jgi:hypothetical protein
MPDLAGPARNAYRGDVLQGHALALVRRGGANWRCYAIDSKTGLNRAVRVIPDTACSCMKFAVGRRGPAGE